MLKYIVKRILLFVPTVLALTVVVFAVIHMVPGDPITVMFGYSVKPEVIARVRAHYNLDKPIVQQYLMWLRNMARADFGQSIVRGDEIWPMIAKRYPRTLLLTLEALLISLLVAFPLSLASARRHNTLADLSISGVSLVFISMPEFWLAILLILVFGVVLNVLPTTSHTLGSGNALNFLRITILPAASIGLIISAGITRMMRTEMVDNLHKDYILFARTKGASEWRTLILHNLRNAVIATSTLVGLEIGYMMGGVVIVEKVFTYPGMGQLLLDAVAERDYPVIQATVLIFALTFVVVNLITDVVYAFLDPRIRYA
jgi:peptide/nickel transport system permease protein